ncbi:MAG: AI-2E family transporter [Clostridia bacterium]
MFLLIFCFLLFNTQKMFSMLNYIILIFSPIIIGIAMAFVINLLVKLFENKMLFKLSKKSKCINKNKRIISIILSLMVIFILFACFFNYVIPNLYESIISLSNKIPAFIQDITNWLNNRLKEYNVSQDVINNLAGNWQNIVNATITNITNAVPQVINVLFGMTATIFNLIISFIIAIYMIFSKEKLLKIVKSFIYIIFNKKHADRIIEIAKMTNKTFIKFVGGQLLQAIILGTLCYIGMIVFNIPYAMLVSVIIAVAALIPYLGGYIGTIPSVIIVFMASPSTTIYFFIFIFCLQQLNGNLIYPKVVGKEVGLTGLWVLIAITIFGNLFGIIGMIIGVPIFAICYILIKEFVKDKLKQKNIVLQ